MSSFLIGGLLVILVGILVLLVSFMYQHLKQRV